MSMPQNADIDPSSESAAAARTHRVLAIDDDEAILRTIARALGRTGRYEVATADNPEQGLAAFEAELPDCVMLDYNMPEMDGIQVLRRLREGEPSVPVIMLTGEIEIQLAVEAMRSGAFDYLTKPPDLDQLIVVVDRAVAHAELVGELRRLRGELRRVYGFDSIIGRHPSMLAIYEVIGRVAPRRASVLITGESGTGKELLARALHHSASEEHRPFVSVNCAAIPDSLFEAELFGHEKGAFTDAKRARPGHILAANGGTLFLDEVGELTPFNQAKLLRALQEREVTPVGSSTPQPVSVRFVAASNRDLEAEVEAGRFRQDLYFRLNVVPITLPPLRDRRSDIPLLVAAFIERIAEQEGLEPKRFTPAALLQLQAAPWLGNVRELENVVERLMALIPAQTIDVSDLPATIQQRQAAVDPGLLDSVVAGELSLTQATERFEQNAIDFAMERCEGNKAAAARLLGISRRILRYKLARVDGDTDEDPPPAED